MARKKTAPAAPRYEAFEHPEANSPMRPDVGTQAAFKKKKPPVTYRYDSSLSPAMDWDGQNPAREQGEAILASLEGQLAQIHAALNDPAVDSGLRDRLGLAASECTALVERLKAMSRPFLNWAGKAERLSFEVPTLPLFVHERLSTKAIIETLGGHQRDQFSQGTLFDLFGDPRHSIVDQITKAYEYKDGWVNRMILGDSLVAMNSLLHFENLGGQVQMIYMDPPYGIKFGSNFQPFVRKRDVSHGDDEDLTREPEMVKAYRDTWDLGKHSYLTYLRDRFLLCRELLASSGSLFVQISDENFHHVRELLDEVFGAEHFLSQITLKKLSTVDATRLASTADYILVYAKDVEKAKYRQLYTSKTSDDEGAGRYDQVELLDGIRRPLSSAERADPSLLPNGSRRYQLDNLVSAEFRPDTSVSFEFKGKFYHPGNNSHWQTSVAGLRKLETLGRLQATGGKSLRYVRYIDDFCAKPITSVWTDISGSVQSRSDPKIYTVQTSVAAIARCVLMSTDPGDLILDPTCGSGTTALVAESWGRRWITMDISRVPLALARQRLLTTPFQYFRLSEESRGPAGGFILHAAMSETSWNC